MDIKVDFVTANEENEPTLYKTSVMLSEDELIFNDIKKTGGSALATKLFGFPWMEEVKIQGNDVSVKKADWVQWSLVAEPLKDLIVDHLEFVARAPEPPAEATNEPTNVVTEGPLFDNLSLFIDQQINPGLASHGGHAELKSVGDGVATIEMAGGCQGCSMAAATLKDGIEVAIKDNFPEITRVADATDHRAGQNPYL